MPNDDAALVAAIRDFGPNERGWSLAWRAADRIEALAKAEADARGYRAVILNAVAVMHGDGVEDQAEAWDKCLQILTAALKQQTGEL